MSRPKKLDDATITGRLETHSSWVRDGDKLHRTLEFDDFVQAFGFMTQVAIHAEKLDHHPDWSNVYKTVKIDLSTHDAGGITDLDFQLAARIDALHGSD